MEAKEWMKVANQLAMTVKKAKKAKKAKVSLETAQAEEAVRACIAISRLVKLAESDAELADPDERLMGAEAGRAEVWGLIMQEIDGLD